jgi:hypothetical protein
MLYPFSMTDYRHPNDDSHPLLTPSSSSKLDHKLDRLESGLADNLYVDNTCRQVTGAIILLTCIIGFVLMGVNAESGGFCPASLSMMLCFGCYGILVFAFIVGAFIAFGCIGMLATCYCCEVCTQCGYLFALCSMISE